MCSVTQRKADQFFHVLWRLIFWYKGQRDEVLWEIIPEGNMDLISKKYNEYRCTWI